MSGSVLRARLRAAEESNVPVLVVKVEELRELFDLLDGSA